MMRSARVVAATFVFLAACGEDEIVKRAKEKEGSTSSAPVAGAEAASASAGGAGVPEQPKPGVPAEPTPAAPGTPQPGAAATPTPGAADAPTPGTPATPQPGVAGAPAGAGTPGEPTPGIPEQPKPGIPTQPPPGGSPGGGGGVVLDGPTVKVSGTVVFPSYKGGGVRVDAFDGDHTRPGTQPRIVATLRLDKPGAFSLDVPAKAGKVYLEAAIDENGDGKPGPQDPQGVADRYPVTVSSAVSGLTITLTKREPPPGGKNKDDF